MLPLRHPRMRRGRGGTTLSLSLNGNVTSTATSGTSLALPALTTTTANFIVVIVVVNGTSVNSVTGAGLTFTRRVTSGGLNPIEMWTAVSASPLNAEVLTVNLVAATTFIRANAFGIANVNTGSPFDSNASLPANSTANADLTISTSNADDFIIGAFRSSAGAPTGAPGAPWITIQDVNFCLTYYRIVSATQTNLTVPKGTAGTTNGALADAIKRA